MSIWNTHPCPNRRENALRCTRDGRDAQVDGVVCGSLHRWAAIEKRNAQRTELAIAGRCRSQARADHSAADDQEIEISSWLRTTHDLEIHGCTSGAPRAS